jgi:anti-sigma factor RsiW
MSDSQFNLQAELARLDRDRAETNKLFEETRKFTAEQHKLMREAEKLRAEEMKLWRDWRLAPWIFALSLIIGALGAVIGRHL